MQDLTKITTPFGLLDKETQEALNSYKGKIQVYLGQKGWVDKYGALDPLWLDFTYRAKPEPLKPLTVKWEHMPV